MATRAGFFLAFRQFSISIVLEVLAVFILYREKAVSVRLTAKVLDHGQIRGHCTFWPVTCFSPVTYGYLCQLSAGVVEMRR